MVKQLENQLDAPCHEVIHTTGTQTGDKLVSLAVDIREIQLLNLHLQVHSLSKGTNIIKVKHNNYHHC